jgi:hypothetical protein
MFYRTYFGTADIFLDISRDEVAQVGLGHLFSPLALLGGRLLSSSLLSLASGRHGS